MGEATPVSMDTHTSPRMRLAVDIGGTFVDAIEMNRDTGEGISQGRHYARTSYAGRSECGGALANAFAPV